MRLWHSKLIPLLDGKRLCDLHMSCCNLRGRGWGKRNISIDYLYKDYLGEDALAVYHHQVLKEMERRGYKYDSAWIVAGYCGKRRPERVVSWENYKEASQREVPLLGHTLEIFLNDVQALRERGLDIRLTGYTLTDETGEYVYNHASYNGKETNYYAKVKEND